MKETLQKLFSMSMKHHKGALYYRFPDPRYKTYQPADFIVIGKINNYLVECKQVSNSELSFDFNARLYKNGQLFSLAKFAALRRNNCGKVLLNYTNFGRDLDRLDEFYWIDYSIFEYFLNKTKLKGLSLKYIKDNVEKSRIFGDRFLKIPKVYMKGLGHKIISLRDVIR